MLSDQDREELRNTANHYKNDPRDLFAAVERIVAREKAAALREAAEDDIGWRWPADWRIK